MTETPLIDLRPADLDIVRQILGRHVPDRQVVVFGSRAKWTAKTHSDLDLCVMGDEPLPLKDKTALEEAFSESDLPIKVDVMDWASAKPSFQKIIQQDAVPIQTSKVSKKKEGLAPEWTDCRLKDIVSVLGDGLHGTPHYSSDGEYYFINGNNLANGRIEIKKETKRVSYEEYLKYRKDLTDRTLLISINGTLGNFASYNGEKIILGKSACYFNIIENVNKCFVKFLVSSTSFLEYINQFSTGTTIKNVSLKTMREYFFKLPPLHEQKAIADVLSALDDKIELNRRMNETLEATAQALFKSWFVDFDPVRAKAEGRQPEGLAPDIAALFPDGFEDSVLGEIPKGWEVKPLGKVASNVSETYNLKETDEVVFINTGDVSKGKFLHENYQKVVGLPGQAKKRIRKGQILYSEIRPINNHYAFVDFEADDYVVSTKFIIIEPNKMISSNYLYLLLTLKSTIQEFQMIAESRSGKFPQITFDAIAYFPTVMATPEVFEEFDEIFKPFHQRMHSNQKEFLILKKIRDLLLPKLMSGELRVNEAEKRVEELV